MYNIHVVQLDSSIRTNVATFDLFERLSRHSSTLKTTGETSIHTLPWITSVLSNCSQRVTRNGSQSQWLTYPLHPAFLKVQSLVLGPLLFLIYINNIVENISLEMIIIIIMIISSEINVTTCNIKPSRPRYASLPMTASYTRK